MQQQYTCINSSSCYRHKDGHPEAAGALIRCCSGQPEATQLTRFPNGQSEAADQVSRDNTGIIPAVE